MNSKNKVKKEIHGNIKKLEHRLSKLSSKERKNSYLHESIASAKKKLKDYGRELK